MTKTFDAPGDFRAASEAEQWLRDNGYYVAPQGSFEDDILIRKWRTLADYLNLDMDGRMVGNMRHGPVTIEVYEKGATP